MRNFILTTAFLFWITFLQGDENWLKEASQNIDQKAIEWTREQLRKTATECVTRYTFEKPHEILDPKECKNCLFTNSFIPEKSKVLIFMSFSVPSESWLSLSKELQKEQGVFILRGLPSNSFQEFSKRILKLKMQGFDGTIQIDPLAFTEYAVDVVPAFIVPKEDKYDKVLGNISLSAALTLISEKGETNSQ